MNQSNRDLQMEIRLRVAAVTNPQFIDFEFMHSRHSRRRSAQRSIGNSQLAIALEYGENIYKQGLIYFILGENNIPESLQKDKDKLKNTVIVVAGDSNQVITCYRSANPFRNVKVKSKKLCKYRNAA